MRTTMEATASVRCPVDDATIELAVIVEAGHSRLMVETLLDCIQEVSRAPLIQEDFTRFLAAQLELPVTTIGTHSGVKITCSA